MTRAFRLAAPVHALVLGVSVGFAADEVSRLQSEIERAEALVDEDRPDSALVLYAEIVPAARATGNVPLIASALHKAGTLQADGLALASHTRTFQKHRAPDRNALPAYAICAVSPLRTLPESQRLFVSSVSMMSLSLSAKA